MSAAAAPAQATSTSLFKTIEGLVQEAAAVKNAAVVPHTIAPAEKRADGPTPSDPGGYQGATTHPSKSVNNDAQVYSEGARGAENTADVKKQEEGLGVTGEEPVLKNESGKADDGTSLNIGLQQSATGEDPSVEDNFKKQDTGEPMPAQGGGSTESAPRSWKAASARVAQRANAVLAQLAYDGGAELDKLAQAKPAAASATKAASPAPAATAPPAMLAGYELARALGADEKQAFAGVSNMLAETIAEANLAADLTAALIIKRAADGDDEGAAEDEGGGGSEGGGESGGNAAPGGSDAGPTAGGSGEGPAAPAMPPAAPPAGGPPGGDMGGAPPPGADPNGDATGMGGAGGADIGALLGGMGGEGMPGPGMGHDAALQELAMALQELGIPLDVLAQAGQAGAKAAQAVQTFMWQGKFQFKEAANKKARNERDRYKNYVRELMANNQ